MEESKLIFSLDRKDEGPVVAFKRECPFDHLDIDLDLGQTQHSKPHHFPHSPSSPGSLSDLSTISEGLLMSHGLVKSSSIELESKEGGTIRGKPLLSLVKSFSTEISRRVEPEVNLSLSDSKLHLHPRKKRTNTNESENGAAPLSAGSLSPTEPRGSSLIAELEDTRRKFSEAMQDPLSMFSKIMGDESGESPKQGNHTAAEDSTVFQCSSGKSDPGKDSDRGCKQRRESENTSVCLSPVRSLQNDSMIKSTVSSEQSDRVNNRHLEICAYGDMIQVVEHPRGAGRKDGRTYPESRVTLLGSTFPFHWLFPVGLATYALFVLPLPPYLTGLSLGVACGFILGLVMVFMCSPLQAGLKNRRPQSQYSHTITDSLNKDLADPGILEGWMSESFSYDPESFHPSLTHSVYATLDGSQLRLAYPCTNIPRWASHDETQHVAVFLHSCIYQLAHSKVSLEPPGLARKRMWNKKYPICIALADRRVQKEIHAEGQLEEEQLEKHPALARRSPITLYLFGRTGREKEEWFQHFLSASKNEAVSCDEESIETPSSEEATKESVEDINDFLVETRTTLDYTTYMTQLMGSERHSLSSSPCHSDKGSPSAGKKAETRSSGGESADNVVAAAEPVRCPVESQPTWVNSLVGRIFWDFLREKHWTDQVAHKIQKKLSKIKLPYFMNELTLADLDMGTCLPQVLRTSKPTLDRKGLWLELEVLYTGCLLMTLETKMNLSKLGKEEEDEAHSFLETQQVGSKAKLCILADSDEESSSAGSSDEEEVPPLEPQGLLGDKSAAVGADGHTGGSTSRKFLKFVDKIAKSKYFQKATENEYIRKKIAEVSNMPLNLSVEVMELSGTLAVNIPPPPTDRIWYSFKVPPKLDLHVRPMLGEREVTFTHVTEWIEKKLQCEFQKVFVMPNMDDLYLPLMTSSLESASASHQSSVHSRQSSIESQEYLTD